MGDIVFTGSVEQELKKIIEEYGPDSVFFLADRHTYCHCFSLFREINILQNHIILIEPGENHKSMESVEKIWKVLISKGARRNSVLINIGGGIVTDVGGFAASCFKRGIKCVNIPTTLLAQVDASVGGKTGINMGGLKNEVGTFSIPECVIIDTCFLKTLPVRQILSGFAEMIKHALLQGGPHFQDIFSLSPESLSERISLDLIKESVRVKENIVKSDPTEKGIRKALNFGHTVGHALESVAIEQGVEFYHGDAVAWGMVAELYLSVKKRGFDENLYQQIRTFIRTLYPFYSFPVTEEKLYGLMLHDKKNEKEGVNFTLLKAPGDYIIDNYCSREEILAALKSLV